MTLRAWTIVIMVATLVIWIVWDVYVAFGARDDEATFSRVLLEAAKWSPVVPLSIGVVLGHLFWPQPRSLPPKGKTSDPPED